MNFSSAAVTGVHAEYEARRASEPTQQAALGDATFPRLTVSNLPHLQSVLLPIDQRYRAFGQRVPRKRQGVAAAELAPHRKHCVREL